MRPLLEKSLPITDVYPISLPNGEIVYQSQKNLGETPKATNSPGVKQDSIAVALDDGTTVVVQNGVVTTTLPNGIVSSVPIKGGGLGDAKTVGSAMQSIGGAVAVIVPVGTVIGAVVAAIGTLISVFSNTKATQILNAQAEAYEKANIELAGQNNQLDQKIQLLKNQIDIAKKALGITTQGYGTSSLNGLGFCLINCAKDAAQTRLNTAKDLYNSLQAQQLDKVNVLGDMGNFVKKMFDLQGNKNMVYVGLGLGFLLIGGLIIQRKFF